MAAKRPPWQDADDHSLWWVDRLVKDAGGDDATLLARCRDHLAVVKTHETRVLEIRDAAATRLRDAGVPMKKIAQLAGVTDSALTRRILRRGGTRRSDRRKRR